MPSKKLLTPLLPDRYYHIFNRGINKEKMFSSDQDYQFFLDKYVRYVHPYVDTYAYCLMPNHFHFLIRVKDPSEVRKPAPVWNQLRKLFICYAMNINRELNRKGNLFTRHFNRIEIPDEMYLKQVVFYIHHNPEKHLITRNFESYHHSSFEAFFSNKSTFLDKITTLNWFDGIEGFMEFHRTIMEHQEIKVFLLEE